VLRTDSGLPGSPVVLDFKGLAYPRSTRQRGVSHMFDRISASFELALSSWQVLRRDKQLILFPVLSGVACVLVLASFVAPSLFHPRALGMLKLGKASGAPAQPPAWVWAVVFAYYFCTYFVIVFCNAALISCALIRFHGGTPTLAAGFHAATLRLPQILAWS